MIKDLHTLPAKLPVPVDDGACDHLPGSSLPSISLACTTGNTIDLSTFAGTVVIYFYPMLARPDSPPLVGWNEIPGARGCTPQSCALRDHYSELKDLGAQVFGASSQPLEDQKEAVTRLHLPFELLSDSSLAFAHALKLPIFEYSGLQLIKRLSLVIKDGMIKKVFYPIFPPNQNASDIIEWHKTQDT